MAARGIDDSPDRGVGEYVRRLRTSRGWTQRQLAERLRGYGWEIDPTGVTRLEQGSRALQVRQLYVLAAVFGAMPSELLPDETGELAILSGEVTAYLEEAKQTLMLALGRLDRLRNGLELPGGEQVAEQIGLPADFDGLVDAHLALFREVNEPPFELWSQDRETARHRAAKYQALLDAVVAGSVVAVEEDDDGEHPQEG